MKLRTAAEEHAMAKTSALYTVERLGSATVQDVMRGQGLCEIRAKKALEDLCRDGRVSKHGDQYRFVPQD